MSLKGLYVYIKDNLEKEIEKSVNKAKEDIKNILNYLDEEIKNLRQYLKT